MLSNILQLLANLEHLKNVEFHADDLIELTAVCCFPDLDDLILNRKFTDISICALWYCRHLCREFAGAS